MSFRDRLRLDGPPRRVAIVTGGSRGLGREMARSLAEAGADVCIAGRTQTTLEAAAALIEADCGRAPLVVRADVSLRAECDELVARTVAHFGRLDIFVNNAGGDHHRGESKAFWEYDDEDWLESFRWNADSQFYCARAAVRAMRAQGGGGVILNIGTGGALRAAPKHIGYAASKAAVMSLTMSLSSALLPDGIRVNAILPGYIAQRPAADEAEAERRAGQGRFNVSGRIGEAWEMGPLAVFLCSDAASYITGQMFLNDGGGLAGGLAPTGYLRPERAERAAAEAPE